MGFQTWANTAECGIIGEAAVCSFISLQLKLRLRSGAHKEEEGASVEPLQASALTFLPPPHRHGS